MIPKIDCNVRSYLAFAAATALFLAFAIAILFSQKKPAIKELPQNIAVIPPNIQSHLDSQTPEVRLLLKRAFQIKKLVENTFFVFTHAQSQEWTVVNDFLIELHKQAPSCNQLYIKKEPFKITDEELFSKNMNDYNYRGKLLSVDGYMWHEEHAESAIYFLKNNKNVHPPEISFVCEILEKLLNYQNRDEIFNIASKLIALALSKGKESKIGALYVIMIEQDQSTFYRSHSFGVPCKCFNDDNKILKDLQNDQNKRCTSLKTWSRGFLHIPQYRVILDPQHKIRSVRLDTLSFKTKQSYQKEIRLLVTQVFDLKKNHSVTTDQQSLLASNEAW